MAGRVNTKFVVLLSSVLVAIVLAMVGFWVLFVQQDPEELIHQGDVALAAEQPRRAVESYGRVLRDRHNDVELMRRYIEAVRATPVRDIVEAKEFVGQIQQWTRAASELRPQDQQLLEEHYELQLAFTRQFLGRAGYQQLHEQTSARLASHPDSVLARKYRGIAQVNRLNTSMARADQRQALEDLETARQQMPEDAAVLFHIVRWKLFEADRLAGISAPEEEVQALRDEALSLSEQMLEQDLDDPHRQRYHLNLLMHPQINRIDEARPLANKLEAHLLSHPHPRRAVLQVAGMVLRLGSKDRQPGAEAGEQTVQAVFAAGVERARRLLEAAVEAHPEQVGYRMMLGRLLAETGQHEPAIEAFEQVRRVDRELTAVPFLLAQQYRLDATVRLGTLLLTRLREIESDAQRQALLNHVGQLVEEAQAEAPQETAVLLLAGKLALLRGDLEQAAVVLERAAEQPGDGQFEAMAVAAKVHRQLGNWGTAAKRLEAVLAQQPHQIELRLELVDIYLDGGAYEQAEKHLQPILAAGPEHRQARQQQARLLAVQGKPEEAIELYRQLDPLAHPQLLEPLVHLYLRSDQHEQAVQLVEQRLDQAPQDRRALRLRLRLARDAAELGQWLEYAEAAGVDADVVAALRQANDEDQQNHEQLVEMLANQGRRPVEQALLRMQLYRRLGHAEQAEQALAEAAMLDPEHPKVIEQQFEQALQAERFAEAQALVQKAVEFDLDQSRGSFYRARLAWAQKKLELAVAHYRAGLSARPVYGEGHRELGDVLTQQGKLAEAVEAYQEAIEQQPDNVLALWHLAQIEQQQHKYNQALEHLRTAMRQGANRRSMIDQYLELEQVHGSVDRAIAVRQRIAQAAPTDLENRRTLAVLLARQDQFEQARMEAEQLVQDGGRTAQNLVVQATVHHLGGESEQGAELLEQYLAERGEQATAGDHVMLARYRMSIGDGDGAMAAYQRARAMEDPKRRPVTRELAAVLFARGAIEQSLEFYRQLHEQSPEDQGVALRFADALLREGQVEQARQVLEPMAGLEQAKPLQVVLSRAEGQTERALDLLNEILAEPADNRPLMLYQRAQVLAQQGRPQDAEADLDAALSEEPDFLPARQMMAELLLRQGRQQEAIRELQSLLQRAPTHQQARAQLFALYMAEQSYNSARGMAEAGVKLFPQEPRWLLMQAQVAVARDQLSEAVLLMRQVVDLAPTAGHLQQLVQLLLEQDEVDEALALLDEHAPLVQEQPLLQAVRAVALEAGGRTDQAARVFTLAIQRSNHGEVVKQIAGQMAITLESDAAEQFLLEGDVELPPVHEAIALAQVAMARREYGTALSRLRQADPAMAANPQAFSVVYDDMLGLCLHEQGAYSEARQAYERVLAAQPQRLGTLNNLAFLLVEALDEPAAALPLAQKAAAGAPQNASVLDTLGWAQYRTGQVEEARQTLERSVALLPLAPACLHLGQVYQALDNVGQARRSVEQAVELAEKANDQRVLESARQFLKQLTP